MCESRRVVSPSGQAVELRVGAYQAEIVEVGAGLRSLRKEGRDVIAGYAADEMCTAGRGQVLLPWPNRIEDGSYEFDGKPYQLPLSEAKSRNAIHGLTRWVNWHLAVRSPGYATWTYRLPAQPGYPFVLDLAVAYGLSENGLRVDISARNLSGAPAPYGHGAHPFLTVGRRINECELTLPASTRCEADARGIPGPAEPVGGGPYDFRRPRLVGTTAFDHPFGGLPDNGSATTVTLRDPSSDHSASLTADPAYRWLQVFSGDALPTRAREALAVEPMTCPPNAFRTGIDLVTLAPGELHTAGFTIG
ncbi:MAG: aldose 1-epimerase [Nocardioidaceae bacterium]|nr:aldose 1-epimerase [Nocardioidaceae bacterium]